LIASNNDMVKPTLTPGIPAIPDILAIETVGPVSPIAPISPVTAPARRGTVTTISVGGYWINHYRRCGQKQTDYCNALAGGFTAAMRSRGHNAPVFRSEQDASPRQWSAATDQDPNGIDTVEFAFIASHGGTHGFERRGSIWLHWFLATFDSPDGCFVSTIQLQWVAKDKHWMPPDPSNPVTTMNLGEGRLRWAVIDCCRSLHIRLENERDQKAATELGEANPWQTWRRCFDGVNMLFGFTGLSSDADWTSDRGASFGRRAGRGEALADSWLDEAYSYWVDDVPVVLSCGRSGKDAENRLKTEGLKKVFASLRAHEINGHSFMWRS
jgi:hypothetical protein